MYVKINHSFIQFKWESKRKKEENWFELMGGDVITETESNSKTKKNIQNWGLLLQSGKENRETNKQEFKKKKVTLSGGVW